MWKWICCAVALAAIGCFALPALASSDAPATLRLEAADGDDDVALGSDGLFPGASTERAIDLVASGRVDGALFSTQIERSSVLDQDGAAGLQISIDSCSERWIRVTEGFRCGGRSEGLLRARPVVVAPVSLPTLHSFGSGLVAHLRLTLSLPSTAPEAAQGAVTAFHYTFAPAS